MPDKLLACPMRAESTSAKLIAFRLVNCNERQQPLTNNVAMTMSSGVVGRNRPNEHNRPDASKAFHISTRRKPKALNVRAAMAFMKMAPIAHTKVRRPEAAGPKPKP